MYPIIKVFEYDHGGAQDLEDWLNAKRKAGYELVAITGNLYVFNLFPRNNPFAGIQLSINKGFAVDATKTLS